MAGLPISTSSSAALLFSRGCRVKSISRAAASSMRSRRSGGVSSRCSRRRGSAWYRRILLPSESSISTLVISLLRCERWAASSSWAEPALPRGGLPLRARAHELPLHGARLDRRLRVAAADLDAHGGALVGLLDHLPVEGLPPGHDVLALLGAEASISDDRGDEGVPVHGGHVRPEHLALVRRRPGGRDGLPVQQPQQLGLVVVGGRGVDVPHRLDGGGVPAGHVLGRLLGGLDLVARGHDRAGLVLAALVDQEEDHGQDHHRRHRDDDLGGARAGGAAAGGARRVDLLAGGAADLGPLLAVGDAGLGLAEGAADLHGWARAAGGEATGVPTTRRRARLRGTPEACKRGLPSS